MNTKKAFSCVGNSFFARLSLFAIFAFFLLFVVSLLSVKSVSAFSHSVLVSDEHPGYFQLRILPDQLELQARQKEKPTIFIRAYNKTENSLYDSILDYLRDTNEQIIPYDQLSRIKLASGTRLVALGDLYDAAKAYKADKTSNSPLADFKAWEKENLGLIYLYDVAFAEDLEINKRIELYPKEKQSLMSHGLVYFGYSLQETLNLEFEYKKNEQDGVQKTEIVLDLQNAPQAKDGRAIKRQFLVSSGKSVFWFDYGTLILLVGFGLLLGFVLVLLWPQITKKLWPRVKNYELVDEISLKEAKNRINRD